MQDDLKKVISQAMSTNSEFEQESIAQFDGELSDEALDAVAGGGGCCYHHSHKPPHCQYSHCKHSYRKH